MLLPFSQRSSKIPHDEQATRSETARTIGALFALSYLNLSRCGLSGDGFDKLSGLKSLKVLNLAFNNITNSCLVHLKDLNESRCANHEKTCSVCCLKIKHLLVFSIWRP